MSLKVTPPGGDQYEGHPDIGDIYTGWSQTSSATPHVVGDSSGSVSSTTFSAIARNESDLLVNKPIVADGGVLVTNGNILSVGLNGANLKATSYGIDSRLLPRKSIPMVRSGAASGAVDLLNQMYALSPLPATTGYGVPDTGYWSLRGHESGFSADGNGTQLATQAVVKEWAGWDDGPYRQTGALVADLPTPIPGGSNQLRLRFRAKLDTASISTLTLVTGPDSSNTSTGKTAVIMLNGVTKVLKVDLRYRNAGVTTDITNSISIASLTSGIIEFGVVIGHTTTGTLSPYQVSAYAFAPGAPATPLVASVTSLAAPRDTIWGKVTLARPAGAGVIWDYLALITSAPVGNSYTGFTASYVPVSKLAWNVVALSYTGPFPPYTGSGWEYLKMLCAAFTITAAVSGDTITFTDLYNGLTPGASQFLQVEDTIGGVGSSIETSGMARYVDINYGVTTMVNSINNLTLYESFIDDGDRSFSINPGEEVFAEVTVPGWVTSARQVTYSITDDEGFAVSNFGGIVQASPSGDGSRLALYINGGGARTVGAPTPWRISNIRVYGEGMRIAPRSIRICTGASESTITQESGGTVDNPFLTKDSAAWDRGNWAAQQAGGVRAGISFAVRTDIENPYPVGSLIRYGNAGYRVMSVSLTRDTCEIKAVGFNTVRAHSEPWIADGKKVADFDAYWADYRCVDGSIRPMQYPIVVRNLLPARYPSTTQFPSELLFPSGIYSTVRDRNWREAYPSVPLVTGLIY